jgi:hypothetical protein
VMGSSRRDDGGKDEHEHSGDLMLWPGLSNGYVTNDAFWKAYVMQIEKFGSRMSILYFFCICECIFLILMTSQYIRNILIHAWLYDSTCVNFGPFFQYQTPSDI